MSLFGIDISHLGQNGIIIVACVFLFLYFMFQLFDRIIKVKEPVTHDDVNALIQVTNREIDNMKEIVIDSTKRTTDSHEKVCGSLNEVALCLRDMQNSTQQQVHATQQLTNVMALKGN